MNDSRTPLPPIVSMDEWQAALERQVAKRPNITLFRGAARFTGPHAVAVNGEELTGEHLFINTGTSPLVPPIDGIRDVPYLTNKTIMDLTQIPEHLVVLGGSYVGLEFGQMFRRFGSRVTVIEYGDQIVPREDDDVAGVHARVVETDILDAHRERRAVGFDVDHGLHAGQRRIRTDVDLLGAGLDRVVRRCLAKSPDDRWQTAADLLEALRWVSEGHALELEERFGEAHAQLVLQLAHVLRERRLAEVQRLRGAGEVPRAGDGHDARTEVHRACGRPIDTGLRR